MACSSSRSLARRSISSRSIAMARSSLSTPWRLNTRTSTTVPDDARRHAQRGVAHVGSLFAEDGAQKLFFRRHRAFALRRDLADQDVARLNFGTDIDDARFVEVASALLRATFGISRVISSGPSLVSRAMTSNSSMWIEVKTSSRDDALGEQDRVLVVVAIPRHERDEHVAAERQIAELGRRTVGDDVALVDPVAHTSPADAG